MCELDEKSLSVESVRSTGSCHTLYNEIQSEGSYSRCEIVTDRSEAESVDLIIFKDHFFSRPSHVRPSSQLWMVYMLGLSPALTTNIASLSPQSVLSTPLLSVTTTSSSTGPPPTGETAPSSRRTSPGSTTRRTGSAGTRTSTTLPTRHGRRMTRTRRQCNLLTRQVAWFVSNCEARNGRLQYAMELSKYIRNISPLIDTVIYYKQSYSVTFP